MLVMRPVIKQASLKPFCRKKCFVMLFVAAFLLKSRAFVYRDSTKIVFSCTPTHERLRTPTALYPSPSSQLSLTTHIPPVFSSSIYPRCGRSYTSVWSSPSLSSYDGAEATMNSTSKAAVESGEEEKELPERMFSKFNLVAIFAFRLLSNFFHDPDIIATVSKAISIIFWIFLVLSGLGTAGVDTKPLLSFLGIGGITLGLPLKEIISNFYMGLVFLFQRPFARGAVINVAGYKGKVIAMTALHLKLRTIEDKSIVLIPTSIVYKSPIKIDRAN